MKKILPTLLALFLMLMTVAACSSGENAGENTNSSKTPSGQSGNDEKVTIEFMTVATWADNLQELVNAFEEKHPNIKVQIASLPFRQMLEGIEVQMNSKKPSFDLFMVDGPLVSNYTVKGFLEPLDSYFGDLKNSWVESSLAAGSYDGKFMAAPLNTSTDVLYYNTAMFEEAGIEFPSIDPEKRMTWDETVEIAKKLTVDHNGDGMTDVFGFTFRQVGRPYQLLPLANSLEAEVISADGFTAEGYTNSDKMVQAGQFYYDLFNTWKVSPKITPDEAVEFFAAGPPYCGG